MNRRSKTPMMLRSGCRGNCADGEKKAGHHHHHHHHHHHYHHSPTEVQNIEQNVSTADKSIGSKLRKRPLANEKSSPSQKKRLVKESSVLAKEERSLNKCFEQMSNVFADCSVQLTPIVRAKHTPESLLETSERKTKITTSEKKEILSHVVSSLKSVNYQSKSENAHNFSLMPGNVTSFEKKTLLEVLSSSPLKEYTSTWTDASRNNVYKRSITKPHYSDYSSGEELELNDSVKTDYTYAWSASYNLETGYPIKVPSPNMSRRSLHTSGNSLLMNSSLSEENALKNYSTTDNSLYQKMIVTQTLNDVAQSVSNQALIGLNTRTEFYEDKNLKNPFHTESSLTYGLDSESDDEEVLVKPCIINSRSKEITYQTQSLFSLICNIGECVFPVQTLWHKTWALIYWIICSVLLWDSWILSRGIFKQKWLPILFILLPLILLAGVLDQHKINEVIPSSIMEAGSLFIPFTNAENKEEIQSVPNNPQVVLSSSNVDFVTLLARIQDVQNSQMNRPEVEVLVRSVIRDEILRLSVNLNVQKELGERQAQSLLDHEFQLNSLQSQMKIILFQSESLGEELRNAKEKIIEKQQTDHRNSIKKLNDLEMEFESLKDYIHQVHETQTILLANMRNCCRNNTLDPKVIENQIALMLLQIMGKGPKPSNELLQFLEWMKSSFVSSSDLQNRMNETAMKVAQEINQGIMKSVEIVAKNVATATIKTSLQHEIQLKTDNGSREVGFNEGKVHQIVQDALSLYDADKTGQADFALETGGGSIISTRCSETYYSRTAQLSMFGIPLWFQSYSPRTVIQPGVHPGECWAFKGSEGYLVIQLSGWVQPSAFSLEHIPRSLAINNLDSAPKDFSVFGLKTENEMKGVLLGSYSYDIEGEPLQFFSVADPDVEAFPIVELRVHSNHGNVDYTCLYRFRVHGKLVKH